MPQLAEPQVYQIKGNEIKCPICRNDKFWLQKAQLNKATSSFFGLDWADKSATCLICSECTHISWFRG